MSTSGDAVAPSRTPAGVVDVHTSDAAVNPEREVARPLVPLKRSAQKPSATQPSQQTRATTATEGPATWRIVAALAVVLGTIFALRWVSRRFLPGQPGSRVQRAVQVVSRTVVSPKEQYQLVHVGRRLVLVGNTGTSMTTLCEITDSQEVAEVLGQVQAEKTESISKAFGSLFKREEEKYDEDEVDDEPAGPTVKAKEPFPPAHDRDIDPSDDSAGTSREEISELLNKVRGMTSQFRR